MAKKHLNKTEKKKLAYKQAEAQMNQARRQKQQKNEVFQEELNSIENFVLVQIIELQTTYIRFNLSTQALGNYSGPFYQGRTKDKQELAQGRNRPQSIGKNFTVKNTLQVLQPDDSCARSCYSCNLNNNVKGEKIDQLCIINPNIKQYDNKPRLQQQNQNINPMQQNHGQKSSSTSSIKASFLEQSKETTSTNQDNNLACDGIIVKKQMQTPIIQEKTAQDTPATYKYNKVLQNDLNHARILQILDQLDQQLVKKKITVFVSIKKIFKATYRKVLKWFEGWF